jgi:hypothetical protein
MRRYFILIYFVLFSCSPVRKYQDLPEVKNWENDIQKFELLDKSEKYPDDAILVGYARKEGLIFLLAKDA